MGIEGWAWGFVDTVTVEEPSGVDDFNMPSYAAGVTYRARIVGKNEKVVSPGGQEVVSRYKVWLMTSDMISPKARVTLPTRFVPNQPVILGIETFTDGIGPHHTILRF